jgi:hypothetical protein
MSSKTSNDTRHTRHRRRPAQQTNSNTDKTAVTTRIRIAQV